MSAVSEGSLFDQIKEAASRNHGHVEENLAWLKEQMHHYFFLTNMDEVEAVAALAAALHNLRHNRKLTLVDREKLLMLAQTGVPGSVYQALRSLPEREISYAQITTSYAPIPGTFHPLEVLRFAFDRKEDEEIARCGQPLIPRPTKNAIARTLKQDYPGFDHEDLEKLISILWLNNEQYVRIPPAERVARILWLYQQTTLHGGIYLDIQETEGPGGAPESRLLFGVGNPPQGGYLLQILEVFNRLRLGVMRAYCLTISTGVHPYFLAGFYVNAQGGEKVEKDSALFLRLKEELYNTQILPASSEAYQELITNGVATGAEASLIRAFVGFCHTNLAHNHPDSFDLEGVTRAFHNHPDISLQLVKLFRVRFDPTMADRESLYLQTLEETTQLIEKFNTGRRFLDEFRRTVFRCGLYFIRHTLKTNFFVPEKHALAFRLDPDYLAELDDEFTCDLPPERPYRITYFSGRYGSGYHIGFTDIARGGWRTLITQGRDDYVTCANTLFRENFVLAYTQHLKNKDIYEGGSKMVTVLDAGGEKDQKTVTQRLYKLQYGFINAFLDILITENGKARDPRVVDYYGQDEPVELGPDENMHDAMVELVARQAVKRGYLLGAGIMSSKIIGINHKEFGVTSTGVIRFAEVTMEELGLNMHTDPFTVKFTGGPNGDVAGNAMKLLFERCPKVKITLIVDGTCALYDPRGVQHEALARIILRDDLQAFDPKALHPGGFILYRSQPRKEGMKKLFKKVVCNASGLEEMWVSNDEFYREYSTLIFTVPADLFIPAGGRPETIDCGNCHGFFAEDGRPNTRAIIEGANSFITPEARLELQKRGIVIMRDASANKCGVISSSYEIIANLMLSDEEFLADKQQYVEDVIDILNRRAEDEARLIFKRHRQAAGSLSYTEISDGLSSEINVHYARLFDFLEQNPHLCDQPQYRQALVQHLPNLLQKVGKYSKRVATLPEKIKYAILASEIASSLVYRGSEEDAYREMIEGHLSRMSTSGAPGV
ncbi:MAG: NAD-glutamate dehydrogenase [bacterium]|nr:NAD-glutamate dehydrogenase [bacterium]